MFPNNIHVLCKKLIQGLSKRRGIHVFEMTTITIHKNLPIIIIFLTFNFCKIYLKTTTIKRLCQVDFDN